MINTIKSIPIIDVAEKLGIKHGNGKQNVPCFKGHDSNTKSMSFSLSKNEFKCFGCGIGNDQIDLVKFSLNIGYKEAILWLCNAYGIKNDSKGEKAVIVYDKSLINQTMVEPVSESADISEYELGYIRKAFNHFVYFFKNPEDGYLIEKRGLMRSVLRENSVVNIDRRLISDFLESKGICIDDYYFLKFIEEVIKDTGYDGDIKELRAKCGLGSLYKSSFAIPFFIGNEIVNIQGINVGNLENVGKYSYLKNAEKRLLYIPRELQDESGNLKKEFHNKAIFVTEGIIDCFSLIGLGIRSVAILDASILENDQRLNQFESLFHSRIYLVLDDDNPGELAKRRIQEFLLERHYDVQIRNISSLSKALGLGSIKDANDFLLKLKEAHGF